MIFKVAMSPEFKIEYEPISSLLLWRRFSVLVLGVQDAAETDFMVTTHQRGIEAYISRWNNEQK